MKEWEASYIAGIIDGEGIMFPEIKYKFSKLKTYALRHKDK